MPEVVIPVPLHWRTILKRGFNQTDGIAIALAQCFTPLEIFNNLCFRKHHSIPQHLKTKQQRFKGMQNAFAIRSDREGSFSRRSVYSRFLEDKTVAIVDDVVTTGATSSALALDVVTTGATSSALATVLINAGAKNVDVWALARTGWHI